MTKKTNKFRPSSHGLNATPATNTAKIPYFVLDSIWSWDFCSFEFTAQTKLYFFFSHYLSGHPSINNAIHACTVRMYLKVLSKCLFNVTSTMEFLLKRKTFRIWKNKNDQIIWAIQIHSTLLYSHQVHLLICLLIQFSKIELALFALWHQFCLRRLKTLQSMSQFTNPRKYIWSIQTAEKFLMFLDFLSLISMECNQEQIST